MLAFVLKLFGALLGGTFSAVPMIILLGIYQIFNAHKRPVDDSKAEIQKYRDRIFPIVVVGFGIAVIIDFYIASALTQLSYGGFFVLAFWLVITVFVSFLWCRSFYLKDNPVKPTYVPAPTIVKQQTAEGLGTLGNALIHTTKKDTPLVVHSTEIMQDVAFDRLYKPVHRQWSADKGAYRVSNEDRGFILGAPGSGKTTYLVSQIVDWMLSGQSFVATDIKPEIWAILKANNVFEFFGYKDWVFNPTDTESDHYNLFSEVKDSAELNEILNIIIQDNNEETSVFNDNARRLLKAVLIELGDKASLSNAQKYINNMDDNAELLKSLRQSENETVSNIAKEITRTAKSDNLLASIMTAVSKAFDFLDDDRIRKTTSDNAEGFYLKEVLMKPKQAIFLQFDQEYKNTTATLFGAMVAHTMRILQANQNRRAVFVALDEIINCAPIPKFTELLNTIRSANMPTFLYLQSLEGLNRLYGANADKIFMGSSNFKVVFRIGDISTAKEFTSLVGQTETSYYSYSSQSGSSSSSARSGNISSSGSGYSSGSGSSVTTKMEDIITPDEFTKLPDYTAVVLYNGAVGTLKMPMYWKCFNMPKRTKLKTVSDFK